jgi:tripartite motif-containing protein 45
MTCSFKLCSGCKDIHKRHTSNHEIKKLQEKKARKSLDKTPTSDATIKCLIHTGNDLKLFCTTCCRVICSECTILVHRGHKMTSIAKAAKIYIDMLRDAKDNTKPITTYAMHSIAKLNEVSKRINQKCEAVEHEVDAHLAEYFQALEIHKRTLLHQIARCRETKMDVLQSQQIDLERRTREAKAAMKFAEALLKEGTEVEGLMFVNMLLRRFDACRSSERALEVKVNDTLEFLPEVQAPSNHIPLFGIITTQIAVAKNCSIENLAGLMNLRVLKKAELVLQTRDNVERPMCHGCASVEVTVLYRDVTFKTLPVHVSDKRDGTYTITFIPDTPGLIQITILVNGKPIDNSPFLVRARNLRPHSGIFHCCSFCSSNGKKVCACGGAMEIEGVKRYGSCGHGHDFHPGKCCSKMK